MHKYEYIEDALFNLRNSVFHVKGTIKKIFDTNFRATLNKNKRFKNLYSGKRCFILGNGPSLKTQDLSLLKNEFVMCVNQCSRNKQFLNIHPNFYLCVDRNFFVVDESKEEDSELLNTFKDLSQVEELECFFPIEFKEKFVERFGLDQELHTNYIYGGGFLTETFSKDFDLTNVVPNFGTVVQSAIMLAIYLGFKEIYLLGCDSTGIIVTLNSIMKKNNEDFYSYEVSHNENKRMENMVAQCGLEGYAMSYYWTIRGYRRLLNYCKKKHIELINCSSETVIDSIPREDYLQVLNKR